MTAHNIQTRELVPIGTSHDRLTVIGKQWKQGRHWRMVCECECGNLTVVYRSAFSRPIASCGCRRNIPRPAARTIPDYVCPTCQKPFRPRLRRSIYCSKKCLHGSGKYTPGGATYSHTCEQCKTTFTNGRRKGRFCSIDCATAGCVRRKRQTLACKHCQKEFSAMVRPDRPAPRFCCRACYSVDRTKRSTSDKPQPATRQRTCQVCSNTFESRWQNEKWTRYCSRECYFEGSKTGSMVPCIICGKETWKHKSVMSKSTNQYCSTECRALKREELCGEVWKGGIVQHLTSDGQDHYLMEATERYESETPRQGRRSRLRYIAIYRLLVGDYIGRDLKPSEPVWHIDRNRLNDNLDNLYVFPSISAMQKAIQNDNCPTTSNLPQLKAETQLLTGDPE